MRRLAPLVSIPVLALLSAGCGSGEPDRAPASVARAPDAPAAPTSLAVSTFQVTVEKGKVVRFEPVKGGMTKAQGFTFDGASLFDFATPRVCNGSDPGDTGSDCSFSAPSCGTNQVCADVTVQYNASGTSNLVAHTWIELRDYMVDGALDTGNRVRLSSSTKDAVPNQLTGKLTASRDHLNYGQMTSGAAATSKRWDFDLTGGFDPSTQSFSFTVDVYTTFTHTAYSVTQTLSRTFPDACSGGTVIGSSGDGLTSDNYAGLTNFELPFPIVIYETSQLWGRATENGVFCLDDNTPQILCTTTAKNNPPLPSFRFPAGSGAVAGFWGDLDIDVHPSSKICAKTTGSAPSRQLLVTWQDMADDNGAIDETISFTTVFSEASDDIEVVYKNPGTITAVTRGSTSVAGLQYRKTASLYMSELLWSKAPYLSATASDYAISEKYVAQ